MAAALPRGPSFILPASSVTPLASPADFFAALLAGVASAHARVTLSALYVGEGAREAELVEALRARLLAAPALRVCVHCDLARALRGGGGGPRGAPAELLLRLTRGADGAPDAALAARVRVGLTLMPQQRAGIGARVALFGREPERRLLFDAAGPVRARP
jgi:hypothetical protein